MAASEVSQTSPNRYGHDHASHVPLGRSFAKSFLGSIHTETVWDWDPRHEMMVMLEYMGFQYTWQGGVLSHEHPKSHKQAQTDMAMIMLHVFL